MRFRRVENIPLFWIWRRGDPRGVGWVRCVCTGRKLDGEWVLDEDGQVTDDPARAHALVAPGGAKGSGINVVMDVLSGILPFCLATVNREDEYQGQRRASHFFKRSRLRHFAMCRDFKREVDRMIQTIRASRPKEGVDRVYVPGEIEWLKKAAWEKTGDSAA